MPALVRLDCCKHLSVSGVMVEVKNNSGVISVWARDLVFGAWDFYRANKNLLKDISPAGALVSTSCP